MLVSVKRLISSFRYAAKGLALVFVEEQNMRIHGMVAAFAIGLSIGLQLPLIEFLLILFSIGMVFVLEIVNTVVERLIDMQKPTVHKYVSHIKDMMAAAVLVSTILALTVGIAIFGTEIWSRF